MQHEPVYKIKTKTTCPKHITVIIPKLIVMVTSARDLKRTIWLMVREKKSSTLLSCFTKFVTFISTQMMLRGTTVATVGVISR